MSPSDTPEKKALPIWQFVPVADYHLPAAPVTLSARERLAFFRRLLQRNEPEKDVPVKTANELRSLPDQQLECITPASAWHSAAEGLDVALEDWLGQKKPSRPVIVLVGPPHNGHSEICKTWAERQAWRLLGPPTPEQILAGDDSWLSEQILDRSPWVFPGLERAYLRHAAGLSMICRFLDHACAGNFGRGIIGCDSWTWAFLQRIWRSRRPITLTPQAFDHSRLADHFQAFADAFSNEKTLFRQTDNAQYVLPPPDNGGFSGETSNFLEFLAAHSRGIFGVALSVWRSSLRCEPDAEVAITDATAGRKISRQTIWTTPWNQLTFPSLPADAGRDEAFLLHTLLLHNGLSLQVMQDLLPMSPNQVLDTISRLEDAGLVSQNDIHWQVSPQGYPVVRQFLKANGYLVDQF